MPDILITRSSMPPMEEYVEEIKELWDSHWITNMGVKHNLLKEQLIDYLNVDKLDLLVNGHMALELAIQAFRFPEGGEIITTPFTFASTTHAIVRNGLIPVFCDVEPEFYTIDVGKIESLITDRTVAILPVHVYGNICDVDAIQQIADRHGLKVIYDAAHAFGETYQGKGVGSFGDVSIFSFHATKVFNTIEGGAVCYRDEEFDRRLYNLKNFGVRDEITVESVGTNAKMNEFCAAMGICNLRHIEDDIQNRKAVFETYGEVLGSVDGIIIPKIQGGVKSNYAYYPILIDPSKTKVTRDDVYEGLRLAGIYSRKYFYPITCDFDCYKKEYPVDNVVLTRSISEKVLTLPIYSELLLDDVRKIALEIVNIVKKR